MNLPRRKPLIACASATLLSGRHRANSNSQAIAPKSYKLSTLSAPLGIQASNLPARASNYSPESPNLGFPPNRSETPRIVTSPWLARSKSVHALCSPVSVSLDSPNAPQPIQLSKATLDHREHPCSSLVRAVSVDRVIQSSNRAIDQGEMVIKGSIRCQPHGSTGS